MTFDVKDSVHHRVLVVGVGSIGERHIRCFQQTGRVTLAVCEVNDQLRETVANRYGVQPRFQSLDEALSAPFDAAVIATPAPHHIPMALRAVEQGWHVLIEKPLSINVDGIDELLRVVENRRLIAAVAYVQRCSPALSEAREAIRADRFGRPLQVVAVAGQHFPFYRPAFRDTYYAHRSSGGGAIQDALTHLVNAVEWIVGPTEQVMADAAHLALPGVEVEDTVNAICRNGKTLVCYALNQHQTSNECIITVVCERATLRVTLYNHRWSIHTAPDSEWIDQPCANVQRDDLFVRQAHSFLDAIGGKAEPHCTLTEGIQTLRTNLAILAAADQPSWFALPRLTGPIRAEA